MISEQLVRDFEGEAIALEFTASVPLEAQLELRNLGFDMD
jgi:hypothetical protein